MRRETPLRRFNGRRLRQSGALGKLNFQACLGRESVGWEDSPLDIVGCRTRGGVTDSRRENQSHMPVRGFRRVGIAARGAR